MEIMQYWKEKGISGTKKTQRQYFRIKRKIRHSKKFFSFDKT